MIFSLNHHSDYKNNAGEIKCPFNQLGTIINFIKQNSNKRYNIILPDNITKVELEKAVGQIDLLKTIAKDYTIQCGSLINLQYLLSCGYNAYLRFPVTDWETFCELRDLEVSDIYIDGPLAFQCKLIRDGKKNVKIRMSPNISSNGSILVDKKPSSFFVRPEDLSLYESFIDIIDFKVDNKEKEDTLYKIYHRGTFNFSISDLIDGLPQISNLMFKEEFGKRRLNCGQKCKIPGYSCHFCETYFKIGSELENLSK